MTPVRFLLRTLGAGTVLGAGVTAYAAWEARAFTLRSLTVPALPEGARPLRVLHLSDLHLTPSQSRKQEWVRSLADLEPDLVVSDCSLSALRIAKENRARVLHPVEALAQAYGLIGTDQGGVVVDSDVTVTEAEAS